MLIFLLLIVGILLLQWQSLQQPYERLNYECLPSHKNVEPDEAFQLVTHLDNMGYWPVPFIRMQENFPQEIILEDQSLTLQPGKGYLYLNSTHFLWPRKRLARTLSARLPQRGRYVFRGATLYVGDLLGFREIGQNYPQVQEIIVFPKPGCQPQLSQTLGSYLGDFSINRFILEDPMLTIGFQDYTGREPQKNISWPQSLRAGRLMVKKFDHTLELSVKIILNIAYPVNMPKNPQNIEASFSLTRSVCEELESRQIQYGLLTNATAAGAMNCWSRLEEGLGYSHLQFLLEVLGRATYDSTCSYDQLITKAQKQAKPGQAFVIITAYQSTVQGPAIDRLQALTNIAPCIIQAADFIQKDDS